MIEANGLPELPEAELFYRVTEDSVEIRRHLPDRIGTLTPMRYGAPPEALNSGSGIVTGRVVQEAKYFLCWEVKPRVMEYRTSGRHELVAVGYTKSTGDVHLVHRYAGDVTVEDVRVKITRKDVPRLAQIALDKYNEMKDRKSLIGDYPPEVWEDTK